MKLNPSILPGTRGRQAASLPGVHHIPWRFFAQQFGHRNFHQALASKELQQELHAVFSAGEAFYDALEAPHGPLSDFHRIPDLDSVVNFPDFRALHLLPEALDGRLRYRRGLPAETDDADDVVGILDPSEQLRVDEAREEVTGEEGLHKPDLAPGSAALKTDPWAICLNLAKLPHCRSSDVFAFWLGVDAIPECWFVFRHWRGGKLTESSVERRDARPISNISKSKTDFKVFCGTD
jgi:hypothetical protein